jgi:hypothetical protein
MASKKSNNGVGLTGILFIVFLVLKLTNNIDWSWWWVTSPLWIPIAFVLSIIFIILFIIVVAMMFGSSFDDIKMKLDYFKDKYKKN